MDRTLSLEFARVVEAAALRLSLIHIQMCIRDRCWLDKFFKLSQHGTNVRTEIFAGITMFIASVYILAVIPNLLVASGMPHESTVAAVILTTAFTTILIGLVANVPVIVAPGLGLSAFFAYTRCV